MYEVLVEFFNESEHEEEFGGIKPVHMKMQFSETEMSECDSSPSPNVYNYMQTKK
jgi:hypothetical protein